MTTAGAERPAAAVTYAVAEAAAWAVMGGRRAAEEVLMGDRGGSWGKDWRETLGGWGGGNRGRGGGGEHHRGGGRACRPSRRTPAPPADRHPPYRRPAPLADRPAARAHCRSPYPPLAPAADRPHHILRHVPPSLASGRGGRGNQAGCPQRRATIRTAAATSRCRNPHRTLAWWGGPRGSPGCRPRLAGGGQGGSGAGRARMVPRGAGGSPHDHRRWLPPPSAHTASMADGAEGKRQEAGKGREGGWRGGSGKLGGRGGCLQRRAAARSAAAAACRCRPHGPPPWWRGP